MPLKQLLLSILQGAYPGEDDYNAAHPNPTGDSQPRGRSAGICAHALVVDAKLVPRPVDSIFSMFNAKIETAAKSPAFKMPFAKQRCVMPVTGFYEWHRNAGRKQPFLISDQAQRGCCWLAYGTPGVRR